MVYYWHSDHVTPPIRIGGDESCALDSEFFGISWREFLKVPSMLGAGRK
jgi:hypothetical protein